MAEHYIGLMSGTSVDGIDAAVVGLAESGPQRLVLKACHWHPYPEEIEAQIQRLTRRGDDELERAGELGMVLGELFAEAANAVLQQSGLRAGDIRAIGSHGQTVRHRPDAPHPFSVQIAHPAVIAERTGITVVGDFRSRDLAAGGQGAPLVPAFHQWLFHTPAANRALVNIGGIANVSYLPRDPDEPVRGFDTGPGNTLLDRWAELHLGTPYDRDGQWGASGTVLEPLLADLLSEPYFRRLPPKSTGRELFQPEWLRERLARLPAAPLPQDVQATLVELTVRGITDALERFLPPVDEVYVCGGGAHNRRIMASLAAHLGRPAATTEALGLHPDWVEAAACAWLAHRTLEGLAGNLPSVTGARRAVILGGIYKA